jgi:hypothetical protein
MMIRWVIGEVEVDERPVQADGPFAMPPEGLSDLG